MAPRRTVQRFGILLSVAIYVCLAGVHTAASEDRGDPPPNVEADAVSRANMGDGLASPKQPARPAPTIIDPSAIYNSLLGANTPAQSWEAASSAVDGPAVLPIVSNIANGATLSYPNVPKPNPCVDFNDRTKWRGQFGPTSYVGWQGFAVEDQGFYRADNVNFGFDASVGNGLAVKISSNQPYAAGLSGPPITVEAGASVTVRVRYMLANIGQEPAAYDWVSLGVRPDSRIGQTLYVNGYSRGRWAELTNSVTALGPSITVLMQAHSPAALSSSVYFDDLEILINGEPIEQCEY